MIKSNIKQRLVCLDIDKLKNWYGKGTYMKTNGKYAKYNGNVYMLSRDMNGNRLILTMVLCQDLAQNKMRSSVS